MAPDRSADELLAYAGELLNAAAAGEQPTRYAALALQTVLATADHPQVCAVSRAAITQLEAAFDAAVSAVIDDTAGALDPVWVAFGMGCGRSLLRLMGRSPRHLPDICDRVDHAALLASEFEALCHRRRIDARRNGLEVAATRDCALAAGAPSDAQFH